MHFARDIYRASMAYDIIMRQYQKFLKFSNMIGRSNMSIINEVHSLLFPYTLII